jgi:hypothetical protein
MPLLRISLDGTPVAAIPTEGREFVGARVGGTIDDPEYADFSAWGGTYVRGDDVDHRVWLDQHIAGSGHSIEVELVAEGAELGVGQPSGRQGKDSPPADYSFENEIRALVEELRGQPAVRDQYRLLYSSPQTPETHFETLPGEYGFLLNVLWKDFAPDRLSVSLHAYTLDSFERQEGGRYGVREKLELGQMCRLTFVA